MESGCKKSMKRQSGTKDNVLVIVAHPDDEVLGCGGTIARLSKEGRSIDVAILGEGITSRYRKREQADPSLVRSLRERSREVAQILGCRNVFTFDFPDNRFDTVPFLDIVKTVEDLVARVAPASIYTHHGGDLNVDHVFVHRAVLTAARPMKGTSVEEICAFETPSSTEWAFGQFRPPFRPNVFVDISTTLDVKLRAMEMYQSELRPFPHPRAPEALSAIAQRWGTVSGWTAAEAFELIYSRR